jgi:septal ring factor EnvC (AmiA/AmiB activator)
LQARIGTAETAHKKLEAELTQLRPHAADLEQQLGQCQVKVKAAQADVTDLRAEALHSKVRVNFAVLRVPQYLCTLAL